MFSGCSSAMPEMDCSFSRKQSLNASAEDICSALGLPDIVVPRLVNSPLPLQCLAAEALPDEMKREIQVITNEYVSPQQEQSSETTDLELQSEPSCVLRLNECINECMALVQSDANAQEIIVPKRLFLNGSGIRLIGGVRCQHTGSIHARIVASQEFHQDGIHLEDGMCVLAWDEFPLEGSTFEEVRRLVKSTSSSHVTLMVKDCKAPVWYPPSTPTRPSPEPSKPASESPDHLSIPKKRPRHISIPDRSPREQSSAMEEDGEQVKRKKKVLPISLPSSSNVVQEDFTTRPLNGMVQLSLRYQTARGLLHITLHKVKSRSETPLVGGDNPSGAFLNTYIFPDIRSQGVKYARPVQSTSSTEEILERSAEYSLPEEEVQRTNLRVIVWESKKKTFKGEVFLNVGNTDVVNLHGVPQWYTICPPDPNLPALPSPFVEQKQGVDTLLNKMKSQTQSLYSFTLRRTKKIGLGTIRGSSLGELPSVSSLKDNPRLSDLPKILETLKDPKPKQALASLSPSQKTNMYDLLARIGELVDKETQHRKGSSLVKEDGEEEESCHNDSIALRAASPCSSEENMEGFDTMSLLSTLGILVRPEGPNGSGPEDTALKNCVSQLSTTLESLREEAKTPREDKVCRFLYSMEEILNDDCLCDGEKQAHQKLSQGCKSQQLALLSLLASLHQSSACDQIEPATSSTTTLGSVSSSVFAGESSHGLPVWVERQADADGPSSSLGLPVIKYSSASWNGGPRHIVSRPCLKRYSFMDRLERMNIELPVIPKSQQEMLRSSWESPLYDRLLPQKQNRQSLPPLSQENSSPIHNLLVQPTSYRNRSKSLNNVYSDEPDGTMSVCRNDSDTDSSESLATNHTSICDSPPVTDPNEGGGESSLDFGCRRGLTYPCGPMSQSLPQPVSTAAHPPIRTSASLGSGLLSRWKSAESLFRPPRRNKPQQKAKFPLIWGRSSTSVDAKMQTYGKGKAIGKMKVQLSPNESSSQVTVNMLDIEFESEMLMNANYEIKVFLYNKTTNCCEDSQDAAMSLKRCGRTGTKLMPNTLHFTTQSVEHALQITISPTEKGFARKKRSYHIWTDLSNMLEQKNCVCSWMKICKVPS